MRAVAFILLLVVFAGCSKGPVSPQRERPVFRPYRFDDHFSSANISATPVSSSSQVAGRVIWHHFLTEKDISWISLRGLMGFRNGDLIVKGDGSTPVIMSPRKYVIDWGLYQTVEISMLTEGGHEIKIKIGDRQLQEQIKSLGQYNVYRFDIDFDTPAAPEPLLVMPTDGLGDLVAIRSIELIPRKTAFPLAAGRTRIGKAEEYRNAIYVHSPSSLTYEVDVPKDGRLHFGMGIAETNAPITFRLAAGSKELYSRTLSDADAWEDADVDISPYAGLKVKLEFVTSAQKRGGVGFWANPLLTTKAFKNRPDVLVYMIDTLRADHTSLYGYARNTTPFLKKFGAEALVFDDCTVQATWTKPSVASLMTSLYSLTHGIRNEYDAIPPGSTTLADELRAAGYVTASVVANPSAGRLTGLQRGFDYLFEWQAVHKRWVESDRGTDSAAVNKVAFHWLDQHRDDPFFLYAHATDPHAPYQPPAGYEEKFANPAETPAFDRDFQKLKEMAVSAGGFGISRALCSKAGIDADRFIRRARDRYDDKILHNDASFEQLVGRLGQLGLLQNTLIIVVSDHGDEFWEHGWTGHGQSLYQELAHGVLLIWNPRLVPSPRRIHEPVQLIDVMPTVLNLLAVKIPDTVEGQSLAPFATGQPFQRHGQVMTSRFAHPYSTHNELIPENRVDSTALVDKDWKLIYREHAKDVGLRRVELYDRRSDRQDSKNVAADHPQEVGKLLDSLAAWTKAQRQIRSALGQQGAKPAIDEATLQKLRSLGYLGGKQ